MIVYCCELCGYLFACSRDGQMFCVQCAGGCIIGATEFKVATVGVCIDCIKKITGGQNGNDQQGLGKGG